MTYRVVDFATYPAAFPGGITVTTKSGRRFEADVPYQRGDEHNPMSGADVREKFRANATLALDQESVVAQAEALLHLEQQDDLRSALHALGGARSVGDPRFGVAASHNHLGELSPAFQPTLTSRVSR